MGSLNDVYIESEMISLPSLITKANGPFDRQKNLVNEEEARPCLVSAVLALHSNCPGNDNNNGSENVMSKKIIVVITSRKV